PLPPATARRASDPTRSPLPRSSRSSRREAGRGILLSPCIETRTAARDTRIWASTRDGEKRSISSSPTQRKCKQEELIRTRLGRKNGAGTSSLCTARLSRIFMSERDQPPAQERDRNAEAL